MVETIGSVCCLCLNNGQIPVNGVIAHTGHPDYIFEIYVRHFPHSKLYD